MDVEARRQLTALAAVERDRNITQRGLAARLGVALGLTNLYLKRLARKGFIKCVNVQRNRLLYLITPKGVAEKTRLTYEFMEYSLHLYRDLRQHLAETLEPCRADGVTRIALFGTGEAAELAYLSLKEKGLEPVAVFSIKGGGTFLGMPVLALDAAVHVMFDRLILAVLDRPELAVAQVVQVGVPSEKVLTFQPLQSVPAPR